VLGAGFPLVAAAGDEASDASGVAPAGCSDDVIVVVRGPLSERGRVRGGNVG
jgi:hypothetical protein